MLVTLDSITTKITKGTTPTSVGCTFENSGVNFIKSESLGNSRNIDRSKFAFISEQTHEKLKRSQIEKNDILFSMAGMFLGKTGIVTDDLVPANTNQAVAIIRIDTEKANHEYVYYYLNQRSVVQAVNASSAQSAQPNINLKQIGQIEIDLPERKLQDKIVSILSAIDFKIEKNNQINENLEQQLHLLFIQIFGKTNLDVPLGDVIQTTSGGTPFRKHYEYYDDGSICWVKSKELLGRYVHNTEEHINELAVSKSAAKLLPAHSVLIAMYGATVGAYGIISKPMACNQAICALLNNEEYPYTYLFQIACESQQKLVNLAVGSAQQNISQVLIKQLPVHSDKGRIREFHSLACPLHEKIEALQAENIKLSEMRDCLLPKLISGELDVSALDL